MAEDEQEAPRSATQTDQVDCEKEGSLEKTQSRDEAPGTTIVPIAADSSDLAQSLQTLSVTNMSGGGATSSAMSSVDNAAAARRHDVVTPPIPINPSRTPELSPAMLSALRGTGSPAHSQVSVGSVGPTLTAASLHHSKYDLTPVTRNTSDPRQYVDHKPRAGQDNEAITITPSSGETYLHGEHLTLDITEGPGPAMPALKPSTSRGSRSSSEQLLGLACGDDDDGDAVPPLPEPQQLSSRKYYSFTTRQQYKEALIRDPDSDDDDLSAASAEDNADRKPTPYAPRSRHANFDIEDPPEEELKAIFMQRRQDSSDSSGQNNILLNPIPMGERIPSLHMAHRLQDSSTSISYTEEEESLILKHDDDASLSSRGSSLYLPEEATQDQDTTNVFPPARAGVLQLQEGEQMDEDEKLIFAALHRKHRKRKQPKKEQQKKEQQQKKETQKKETQEWLQSIEADKNVLAEAASSKFLTGNNANQEVPRTVTQQASSRRQSVPALPLKRQTSMPPNVAGQSSG